MTKFYRGDIVWYNGDKYVVQEVRGLRGESVTISDEEMRPLDEPNILEVDECFLTLTDWDTDERAD
jgi:hypothetical protein